MGQRREFLVLSIRSGLELMGSQIDVGGTNETARDRNRLCIEVSPFIGHRIRMLTSQDPFEVSYNVARTVTKDGLYTVCLPACFLVQC